MAGHSVFRHAGEAGEEAGGEVPPGGGEGSAAELRVDGRGKGGGVHASDPAEEVAVELFSGSIDFGGGRGGNGLYFGGVGEDKGDQ